MRFPTTLAILLIAAAPAMAAPAHMEVAGQRLLIRQTCADHVTITADGTAGRVTMDAEASHAEELSQLRLASEGDAARLGIDGHRCWGDNLFGGWRRTLRITVHVPSGMAMEISEGGGADYTAGDIKGPLTLDLSGGVTYEGGAALATNIQASGGVRIELASVTGKLKTEASGGATLKVAHIDSPEVSFDGSGGVDASIGEGTIGRLKAEASGGVSLAVRATVGNGEAEASGGGSISLARVTGKLEKDESIGGSISVGD